MQLSRILPVKLKNQFKRWLWRNDLCRLAEHFGTDKWGIHRYAKHYQTYFDSLRNLPINILEIGVGGHDSPTKGGASLRLWKEYFPKANIYAIDLFDKSALEEDRIKIFKGSQNDSDFLLSVFQEIGHLDIIIDDGSHINEHVITSFNVLFPLLASEGIYVIEDMQTAYWEEFGGTEDPKSDFISTSIPKKCIDWLNWEEFREHAPEVGKTLVSLHAYHNIIFLQKGENIEGSNKHFPHRVHN